MESVSPKSRLVALLLAFFLGMFGAHRFYVGKIGTAIFQLILTITIIGAIASGIWVFIDLIMIAVGSFRDGDGKKVMAWDPSEAPAPQGTTGELEKYAELRNKGIITEEEFQTKKKALLST